MTTNVGTIDSILRATPGATLLFLAVISGLPAFDGAALAYGAGMVGSVMLGVAAVGVCPVLGIRTCPIRP